MPGAAPGAARPAGATVQPGRAPAGTAQPEAPLAVDPSLGVPIFLGFYAFMLGVMRLWSRVLARGVTSDNVDRSLRRFSKVMLVARLLVPAWFGIGLFLLGWGAWVNTVFRAASRVVPLLAAVQVPALLVGTFPAFVAWMGLWWSQYPADHSLRQHNLLDQLEAGEPVYAPPTFREYFAGNLRLQVLFTVAPVIAILLVRDVFALAVRPVAAPGSELAGTIEFAVMAGSTALVFLFAPELLRRVLHTQPLPDSPLRRRLEDMCRRVGMRYRDILLWHTQNNMGNAAVMGILPPVRYILLSDLLLERMDDEQIEAVFAHEVGHVVHRHMAWYVVVIMIFTLGLVSLEQVARRVSSVSVALERMPQDLLDVLSVVAPLGGFLVFFGFVSRRFERQADVYAARTMEESKRVQKSEVRDQEEAAVASPPSPEPASPSTEHPGVLPATAHTPDPAPTLAPTPQSPLAPSHVGPYGATVFASALHRVAVMNNIPVVPRRRPRRGVFRRMGHSLDMSFDTIRNWFHGSVPHRMDYLRGLSTDPSLTHRFDRFMLRLYCALLFVLFAAAAFVFASSIH
jgi:Zn-dependent protease with chaperone function